MEFSPSLSLSLCLSLPPPPFPPSIFIFDTGINTVAVPMYISEISPIRLRGSMGVCHQMAITITILLSQLLGLNFVCWPIVFCIQLCHSHTHNSPFYISWSSLVHVHSHSTYTCRSELAEIWVNIDIVFLCHRYWVVLIVRAMGGESYSHSPFCLSYSKSWFCRGALRALGSST